jgi:hypothetical protein
MNWKLSNRADPLALPLADRHYNRQKIGSPQFVPPGRCLVLMTPEHDALWVTSFPFAEYVKHAWAGAWMNSMFRNEGNHVASELITQAVAATRWEWDTPPLGMVTFIDRRHVKPMKRRGRDVWGYCYRKAGFLPVGETKGGLLAFQLLPEDMPAAAPPFAPPVYSQMDMFAMDVAKQVVSISKGEGHMDENLIGRIIERLQALQAQHGDLPVTVRIDMDWGGSTDIPVGSIEFCEADEIEKMVLPNRIVILLD